MSVHYKFKNTITYDAIKFDGVYISATDLKAVIASQKKLSHSELQVANEETNEVYTDDQLIPKNTNVVVLRVPFANSNKRARINHQNHNSNSSGNASGGGAGNNHHHHNNHHHNNHHHHHSNRHHDNNRNNSQSSMSAGGSSSLDPSGSSAREALELVSTKNMTEEEKIKYIQSQSTKDFDPARYARGRGGGGYRGGRGGGGHRHFVPGPGYTCRKCGIPGHSIYDCKMSTVHKVKRSSGIPRDFLMKVDSKEKGALMTPSGEYAVPYIDREAYNNPKVEKAPFFEDGTPSDDDPPAKRRQATAQ